jgi:thioester reductase-like protein
MMANNLIFMTGATGVLGQDLVKELLRTTDAEIAILSRAKNLASHSDGVKKILKAIGLDSHLGSRIHVIEGDVTWIILSASARFSITLRRSRP